MFQCHGDQWSVGLLIMVILPLGSRGSSVKGRIPRAVLLETRPGTSPFGTDVFLDPMKPELKSYTKLNNP